MIKCYSCDGKFVAVEDIAKLLGQLLTTQEIRNAAKKYDAKRVRHNRALRELMVLIEKD